MAQLNVSEREGIDPETYAELIESNIVFAQRIAAKFSGQWRYVNFDREDFEGAAIYGLATAAERFKPGMGSSFKSFAYLRIRGAMFDMLRENGELARIHAVTSDHTSDEQLEVKPDRSVYSEVTGIGLEVNESRQAVDLVYSLDQNPEETMVSKSLKDAIGNYIEALPKDEKELVRMRYLDECSFEEIRRTLGDRSRSCVCRMHNRALKKLKELMRAENLSLADLLPN